MNQTTAAGLSSPANPWLVWWPVALGLLALYVPTFVDLSRTIWETQDQGHGPIILAVAAFLFWQGRAALLEQTGKPAVAPGCIALIVGLLLYVLGRSQGIVQFEVGSLIPVIVGTLLILRGWRVLRALWFPLVYLLFLVPLPGIFVVAITGPLKQYVSIIAENLLYMVGYPIARQGVTLSIGPYQLLVADACSGLHSIFSLFAIGLLYVYISRHVRWQRNLILVLSLVPLAMLANVLRVIVLVLVTYHFGDEAGQGFLHGAAGMVLFIIALTMLFAVDKLLGYIFPHIPRKAQR